MSSIAAFPMYDFPELETTHDEVWSTLRRYLIGAGVVDPPAGLTHFSGQVSIWTDQNLLLGQGCEYPLAKFFADRIRIVAIPRYSASGCMGGNYRSAIVVRNDDPSKSLSDLKNRRCSINEPTSNSGMNLLRAAIAPIANGKRFFSSVTVSGSHLESIRIVAAGEADLAAVDCVSFAHFERMYPSLTAPLRILDWTPSSPSLPYITAATTSDDSLRKLRSCLAALISDPGLSDARARLFLTGFELEPAGDYAEVLEYEAVAARLGYPQLI